MKSQIAVDELTGEIVDVAESVPGPTADITLLEQFCPDCPSIQASCAEKGAEVHLILDEKVYNRLKNDFEDEYNTCLKNKVSLYIYSGKLRPSSFMIADTFMMLKLFGKDGEFDHRKITSFTPSALEWGNELAQYYIDRSEKIT